MFAFDLAVINISQGAPFDLFLIRPTVAVFYVPIPFLLSDQKVGSKDKKNKKNYSVGDVCSLKSSEEIIFLTFPDKVQRSIFTFSHIWTCDVDMKIAGAEMCVNEPNSLSSVAFFFLSFLFFPQSSFIVVVIKVLYELMLSVLRSS